MRRLSQFIRELRRRRVFRVATLYIVGAWVVLQVAALAFPSFDIPDNAIGYVWIATILGFPIALVLGWRYDIVDGQIVRTKAADESQHLSLNRADYVVLIAFVVVTIGITVVIVREIDGTRSSVATQQNSELLDPTSIAVLPFLNISDDASNDYFAIGIAEELLNVLAKLPRLRVTSRSSSFSFKDQGLDIRTIAAKLNVAYVLEGSVRKSGNRVRISAQLIDTSADKHLWSETYDRELKDIFEIQDEISAAIVGALKEILALEIDAAPRVTTETSIGAHDAYLRGSYLLAQHSPASVQGAIREFGNAIALDHDYALAHAKLAIAWLMGLGIENPSLGINLSNDILAVAERHAEMAMVRDPTLAEAHAAAGHLSWIKGKQEEALSHYEKAIQFNPNYSEVYARMGIILEDEFGRHKESFAALERAMQIDPLSISAITVFVNALMDRNRFADADSELEKLATLAPGHYARIRGYRSSLGGKWASLALGNLRYLQLNPVDPAMHYILSSSFALLGLEFETLAAMKVLRDIFPARMLGVSTVLISAYDAAYDAIPESIGVSSFLEMKEISAGVLTFRDRGDYGIALASAGRYAQSWPLLEDLWSQRSDQIARDFGAYYVAALITMRRDRGDVFVLDDLLTPLREEVHRMNEAGITAVDWSQSADFTIGLADYLAGEKEKGLELIARAAEDGYFILPNEAYLEELYNDPGFAPIRENQEFRQARERNRFLAVVCRGNPYASVWQPQEATCKEFAAASVN